MFLVIFGGVILIKLIFFSFFLNIETYYIIFLLYLYYVEWCIYSGFDINFDGDEDDDDS